MPERLEFTEEQTQQLTKIAKYYRVAKELIIYGEQIDTKNRTLAQTLSERANALDHIMRVILEKTGMRDDIAGDPVVYNRISLDKAYGHIYRTAYDALDWVALTIQERLATDIGAISLETISAIMPDYFTKIKPGLYRILHDDITRLRNEKDVANENETNLEKYTSTVFELKQLFDQVNQMLPDLITYEKRLNVING
jgi:DNA repair ATPase RecN